MKRLILSFSFLITSFSFLSQLCGTSVVPPAVVNGVSVTSTFTGSTTVFTAAFTSCTFTTPPNSIHLGGSVGFTYTFHFAVPVNNVVLVLTATGSPVAEVFTFVTNNGNPTITVNGSCFTTVAGNVITSGASAGTMGGGGIFTFTRPTAYTSLTISGPGGSSGSLFALCSSSVAPSATGIYDTICQGDSLFIAGAFRNTAGIYVDSLTSSSGVDSIVTTNLSIESTPNFNITGPTSICLNKPVTFESTVSGDSNLSNFSWNFGDGNSAIQTDSTIQHTYTTAGMKTIVVSVTSDLGCSYDTTWMFDVLDIEPADFAADSVCLGFPTNFTGLSNTANVANWRYLVEGSTYSSANFSHIFGSDGVKSVRLIVTNLAGCSDTISKNIIVYPKPTMDFSFAPGVLSASDSRACFDNRSSNATLYSWDFGFSTSTLSDPCVDYPPVVGFFPVKLVGENVFGCKDSITKLIEYRDIPLVYVPSSFTPDDDGINDDFFPVVRGVISYSFSVFNRWGELIFESKEIGKGWNGKHKSELSMNGIYIYHVRVILPNNSTQEYTGHVQLLR